MCKSWTKSTGVINIARSILLTILTIIVAFTIFKSIKFLFRLFNRNIYKWKGKIIRPLQFKSINILNEDQIIAIIKRISLIIQFILNVFLLYIFIPIIFSFFDFTQNWADKLFGYILNPLKTIGTSFIKYSLSL